MKLTIEEFHHELTDALRKYLPNGDLEIFEMSMLRLKMRFYITISFFIDIFYAARTNKVSLAVIHKGRRIFGIDNLGNWHSHPLGSSEDHVKITAPSIEKMILECAKVIKEVDEEG